MSNLYIKKVTMPTDLAGTTPGKLPESLLVKVDGGKLHHAAAYAWMAMKAAAAADGIELKPTSAGDLYRTYDSQLSAFKMRYQKEPIEGASTRTFEGQKWYLKKGNAPLAAPGTSQHNSGLAVDVHTASGERLKWMVDNCVKFGFSWEVVPEEPWHIRYTEGDNTPEAVKQWMAANNIAGKAAAPTASAEPAEQKPATAPAVQNTVDTVRRGKEFAASNPVLKLGSSGPAVRTLQTLLNKFGYKTSIDGNFGPKTEEAVKAYQKAVGFAEDGIVANKVWARINP
jgi:hypothetical protein